jgi:hypothetical protein
MAASEARTQYRELTQSRFREPGKGCSVRRRKRPRERNATEYLSGRGTDKERMGDQEAEFEQRA